MTEQTSLGELISEAGGFEESTNADIVFVIDATESMAPIIDTVKSMTLTFYDDLIEGLRAKNKIINQLRVRVIVYRDYYCDGPYAMEESDFFYLPEEKEEFNNFVSEIEAKGGGDEPESGLEALGLAMMSDWVSEGEHKRHIIALFTDASAHPLEKAKGVSIPDYPDNMYETANELYEAWQGQGRCMGTDKKVMERRARRLVLFAPDAEPWTDIAIDYDQTISAKIEPGRGCNEAGKEAIIKLLSESV